MSGPYKQGEHLVTFDGRPHIYWTYYPKLKRGYWRVSAIQHNAPFKVRELWRYAHKMCLEMNNPRGDVDEECERAVSR